MKAKETREQFLIEALALFDVVDEEDIWDDACEAMKEEFPYRKIVRGQPAPAKIKDHLEWQYRIRSKAEREIQEKCKEASKGILPLAGKVIAVCLGLLYVMSLFS